MSRYRTICSTALVVAVLILVTNVRRLTRVSADGGGKVGATESDRRASFPGRADAPEATPAYVGTKRCRMCHSAQYRSWRKSRKHDAWQSLMPGTKIEPKQHAGLDVAADYRTDRRCLRCHAVGFGQPGGYAVPDPSDRGAVRAAGHREGVGCEACHGPGSAFVPLMSEVSQQDRHYDPSAFWKAGQTKMSAAVCGDCHNDGAFCVLQAGDTPGSTDHRSAYEVNYADRTGYHEAFPLQHECRPPSVEGERPTTAATSNATAPASK